MAQFDVYRSRTPSEYLLDCQADLLSDLNTRFVVPLMPIDVAPIAAKRLNPIFEIEGEACAMVTQYASTVAASELRDFVLSLADHDFVVGNAIDMLISGY